MSTAKRVDFWRVGGWVFLTLLLLFAILPMAWMLLTSIKTQFAAAQYPPEWWPHSPTLQNYTRLLSPTSEVGQELVSRKHTPCALLVVQLRLKCRIGLCRFDRPTVRQG